MRICEECINATYLKQNGEERLRIAIVTSRGCVYPSPKFPQYMDQDNCFRSLSAKGEVCLIGSILVPRAYATSQLAFTNTLRNLPSAWNNRWAAFLSTIPPVRKLRDGLDLFSDAMYTKSCLKYLSSCDVNAIYSFPWPFDRYVVKWARRLSKPLIIEMWEDYACFTSVRMTFQGLPRSAISREATRIYRWMRDVANGADRVIVPTRVFADRLHGLGVDSDKIRVIPVCVDPSPLPASDSQYIREKHNLNDEEEVVFYIGSLSPVHDLFTLIRSIQYVKSKLVFIIASGRSRDLEQQTERYASGKARIIFTGRLESSELEAYLSSADICVAPYRFSQFSGFFPAKVVRYMLAGKAIVATDLPELREMFQNREAGVLVPQEDPEALAQALDRLAEDSQERLKLGSIAKVIAKNSYLTEHHTEQLMEVFTEVLYENQNLEGYQSSELHSSKHGQSAE